MRESRRRWRPESRPSPLKSWQKLRWEMPDKPVDPSTCKEMQRVFLHTACQVCLCCHYQTVIAVSLNRMHVPVRGFRLERPLISFFAFRGDSKYAERAVSDDETAESAAGKRKAPNGPAKERKRGKKDETFLGYLDDRIMRSASSQHRGHQLDALFFDGFCSPAQSARSPVTCHGKLV